MSMPAGGTTSRRRMLVRGLGVGLGLLALAGLFLSGGLDAVPRPGLPTIAVGAVNEARPWNVTVTGARVRDGEPPSLSEPGNHWLEVLATVEITVDSSDDVLVADVLSVSGIDGLLSDRPLVRMVRDGANIVYLHPGMPEEVILFWERSRGTAVPKSVEVLINGKTLRRESFSGLLQWMDPAPRARVRVPLADRRTSR